jgi:hypothetical protein
VYLGRTTAVNKWSAALQTGEDGNAKAIYEAKKGSEWSEKLDFSDGKQPRIIMTRI